jgi:glyoxylase-like metal-dependent hydrolase (beta-lactamase superfamily II)
MADDIRVYETDSGKVFQIALQAFPGFFVNVYVVLSGNDCVLIDTGSGFGRSNSDLLDGFHRISSAIGYQLTLADVSHIFLTHAHIDHFGGLPFIRDNTQALIGIHELDRRIITNYEETLALVSKRLANYFVEAGLPEAQIAHLIEIYRINKSLYHSVECDFTYESNPEMLGPFEFLHVPGHTAGHVMLRFDGVVFTGDHILEAISPHQAPEQLTLSTGLMHYLSSLQTARGWYETAGLILPGHNGPLQNTNGHIDQIINLHRSRLKKVIELCEQATTIDEISRSLFKNISGYNVILALEETGAHVEYLHQCGVLNIANFREIENSDRPIPIHYQSFQGTNHDVAHILACGKTPEGR